MSTPTSVTDFAREGSSAPTAAGAANEFAALWNACSSYQEALSVLNSSLGLSVGEIRLAAKVLYQTGAISPLPVKDGTHDLTDEDVLRFSLIWNKSHTLARVANVLGLPLDITAKRAQLLRGIGVMLQPLTDFNFSQGTVLRPEVWAMPVDDVNDILNGEIIVRSALLKQAPLRAKVAAMVACTGRLKAEGARTPEQEVFVSLAESFLRELGVF